MRDEKRGLAVGVGRLGMTADIASAKGSEGLLIDSPLPFSRLE